MDTGTSPGQWLSQFLFWHAKTILICGLVGLIAGAGYGFAEQRTWTATAELVTGTYTLPASISNQAAVQTAGPLGLELSADTQAQIIASPSIVSIAVNALGKRAGDAATFVSGVSAAAVTENSYSVTATGASADEAALRANALARAYLTYRQNKGRSELYTIAKEADADAASNTRAAAALNQQIAAARRQGSNTASLVQRQQGLLGAASDALSRAAQVNAAAQSFDGGGTVPRPATAAAAQASASPIRWAGFGLLGGLVIGAGVALLRQRLSDRLLTDEDIASAAGLPVLLDLGPRPRFHIGRRRRIEPALDGLGDLPAFAARAIERRQDVGGGADAQNLLIRPLSKRSSNVYAVIALTVGYGLLGRDVAVVVGAADQVDLQSAAKRFRVPLRSRGAAGEGGPSRNGEAARAVLRYRLSAQNFGAARQNWTLQRAEQATSVSIWLARAEDDEEPSPAMPDAGRSILVVARGVDLGTTLHHAALNLRDAGFAPAGVVIVPTHYVSTRIALSRRARARRIAEGVEQIAATDSTSPVAPTRQSRGATARVTKNAGGSSRGKGASEAGTP